MKKFLYKVGIYSFFGFIFLNLLSFLCLYALSKSTFYKQQWVKNGINEKSFDYVILGSSTGLTTLDSKQIDSMTGLNGINISMDDSSLTSHFLMLQHFYASGKNSKKLILAVRPDDLKNNKPTINTNDYRFLPHIWDNTISDFFLDFEDNNIFVMSKYIPLYAVSYYNTELFYPSLYTISKPGIRNLFDERGNYSYPNNGNYRREDIHTIKTVKVYFNNPYLNKILHFCQDKKIELILYQSPISGLKTEYPNQLRIIDHSSLLENDYYFYDQIHVNKLGRNKCTEQLVNSVFTNDNKKVINGF